ncbi:2-keto-4-pentenoate hydratase [Alicyclobacillus shizuokensis]|uniref:2-keto-4-pentenoate hydratase n=1 Tax=Alicyclobacillus shizuokensis TaxID=392014 RepID=UPI0008351605|nr:fumarylacetoacetate hydrolase family protein [Alicyclobacillus shizuokensis]MCL6626233.1 fumarylacetoacetate hydrolase family protein [Alicyclobacillus shizuokensis]
MDLRAIAEEVWRHQANAAEMEKLTQRYSGLTVADAYEIQRLNAERAVSEGDVLAGWKMGLTSRAKQLSVGVEEPIYGRLFGSREMTDGKLSLTGLIHPRVEPELAFVFKHRLAGPQVTARDVWLATECVMPAVEIIDSRYRDFSFTLVDVVADNASFARFLLADRAYSPYHCAWDEVGVAVRQNGEVKQTGAGAAVLGHPVRAVVQLARMLAQVGQAVEPGMVVLTGGITEAIHLHRGDEVVVDFDGLGELRLNVYD